MLVFGFILMGCSRDVSIGVQNLPEGETFRLEWSGGELKQIEPNQWRATGVASNQSYSMTLWYGQQQCTLDQPELLVEYGLGAVTHLSDWTCAGMMGYEMLEVDELWIGKSEVTVGLWRQLKGDDVEDSCGATCPKSNVNWIQTLEFANQLSMMEGLEQCYVQVGEDIPQLKKDCTGYRLPTDDEWMKVSTKVDMPYADSEEAVNVGWVKENSEMKRHPVCEKQPNGFGLCDMTGNVWEWTTEVSVQRPELRRVRGGGFTSAPEVAMRTNAVDFPAHIGAEHIGFRLVRQP